MQSEQTRRQPFRGRLISFQSDKKWVEFFTTITPPPPNKTWWMIWENYDGASLLFCTETWLLFPPIGGVTIVWKYICETWWRMDHRPLLCSLTLYMSCYFSRYAIICYKNGDTAVAYSVAFSTPIFRSIRIRIEYHVFVLAAIFEAGDIPSTILILLPLKNRKCVWLDG